MAVVLGGEKGNPVGGVVELIPAGRDIVQQMSGALHRVEKEWMSCLTLEQRQTLVSLLVRLLDDMPKT